MVETIYGGALGTLAALAFNRIAIFQIKRRTQETSKIEAVKNIALIVTWGLISGVLFAVTFLRYSATAA